MENYIDFRNSARIGYINTFYEIAAESMTRHNLLIQKVEILKSEGKANYETEIDGDKVTVEFYLQTNNISETEHEIDKEIIKIVIFLSTFLESYIWELSATTLGESFTKNHLDKLDTLSKWKIIPKLLTGKEIDFDNSIINDFKSLIRFRNKFVHHKTKDLASTLERLRREQKSIQELSEEINVVNYFKSIKKLFEEMDKIDPEGNHLGRVNWHLP